MRPKYRVQVIVNTDITATNELAKKIGQCVLDEKPKDWQQFRDCDSILLQPVPKPDTDPTAKITCPAGHMLAYHDVIVFDDQLDKAYKRLPTPMDNPLGILIQ